MKMLEVSLKRDLISPSLTLPPEQDANEKAKVTVNNTQSDFFTYLFINSPRKNYNIQA